MLYNILGELSKPWNSVCSSFDVNIAGTTKSLNCENNGFGTVAAKGSAMISFSPSKIVNSDAS